MRSDMELSKDYLVELFPGAISEDVYETSLNIRDTHFGNKLHLKGEKNSVIISWQTQIEIRYLNQDIEKIGYLLSHVDFSKLLEPISSPVIYEIKNSSLIEELRYRSFDTLSEDDCHHYLILTGKIMVSVVTTSYIDMEFQ